MAAAALLASGCGKKGGETASQEETASQAPTESVKASVTLGEYTGLEVTKAEALVTDEQVDEQIKRILQENPEETTVTDRPAQEGDVVNIDYVGMKDGEAFAGGTAAGHDLKLGSNSFIDGFEDGLVGANTGDELSLNLTFPENSGNAELAGQAVVFDVTVNAIKEQSEAELTDEFVKRVSKTSTTVEAYRKEIREQMEESARQDAKIRMQNQAMDLAMAASSFESLDPQVDLEFQLQMEEINEALKQGNMTLADYTAMFGMDEESFNSFMRADIENRLKVTLTAEAIAKAENLEVDDDARLEVAKVYGLENIEDLVARYGQEAVDEAARNVKVMDFLLANAKMVEEETSADEAETAAAEESSEAGEASESEEPTKAE